MNDDDVKINLSSLVVNKDNVYDKITQPILTQNYEFDYRILIAIAIVWGLLVFLGNEE